MSVHRIAALGVSVMVLIGRSAHRRYGRRCRSGSLHGRQQPAWSRSASTGPAPSRCRPRSSPASTTFQMTTRPSRLGLPAARRSRRGYTLEQADRRHRQRPRQGQDQGPQALRGQHHAARWGRRAATDKAGKLAVDLEPGTYYAVDIEQDRLAVVHAVHGRRRRHRRHACPADATRHGGRQHEAGPRARRHPAQRAWLTFKNRGRPEPLRRHGEADAGQDAGRLRRRSSMKECRARRRWTSATPFDCGVLSPGHDSGDELPAADGQLRPRLLLARRLDGRHAPRLHGHVPRSSRSR